MSFVTPSNQPVSGTSSSAVILAFFTNVLSISKCMFEGGDELISTLTGVS